MNKVKEQHNAEKENQVKKPATKSPARNLVKILNGEFFTRETVTGLLPFVGFLSVLAILYISNTFYAEKTIRNINTIHGELKELKAEFITAKSDRMFKSKQSEVAKAAENIGIKESVEPPVKLISDNK